ncbi:hypothetical protein Tco_0450927 [Tanacetum coccineum]
MTSSYALSWKPCQGDSLNLPDHRIHKDGDGDASFQLKSDSLPHAHAQSTKTFYKHQDSRIMKAQELKTKTSAQTLIYKIFLQRYQVYQGRLLASFQDDAKYEHVGQDTRSQGGKDDQDKQGKDLKISDIKTKSKDNDKGSRSKITKHEGTSLQRIQRPRPQDLNDKSNLIDLMKECHNELTSGEIVSLKILSRYENGDSGSYDSLIQRPIGDALKEVHSHRQLRIWEPSKGYNRGITSIFRCQDKLFWEFGPIHLSRWRNIESYYTRFYKMMNEMIKNNLTVATMQIVIMTRLKKDKEMQKNLALIAKYFKKIYKPTNNNLRTSSNTRNKNVDTTPRFKNDNHTGQFGNQRAVNVVGARETVGGLVVQQSGIQCFNFTCKVEVVPCRSGIDLSHVELLEKGDSDVTPDSPDMCR